MLIVPSRKAVILKVENPAHIFSCIPTAKAFPYKGQELVYVPHNMDETKVLRNLGVMVPSPVGHYYRYTGKVPFDHQRKTTEFLTLHHRCAVLNQMRCVDKDTEYLSDTGWKKISEYDGGKVAQYAEGKAEFVEPEEYHVTPCETMIHFTTRSIDQMLSPGHRVLMKHPNGKEYVVTAEELHQQMQRGEYDPNKGGTPVVFGAPERTGLPLTDAQLRVMVAVIADGHFPPNSTSRVTLRLKKERKIERLRSLLGLAGIPYAERFDTSETGYGFYVFAFYAPRKEKDFSQWWECTAEQLAIVADEVLHWDGNVTTGRDRFSTYLKATADFVQYAFAATGKNTSLKVCTRERRGKVETEYVVQVHKTTIGFMVYGHKSTAHCNSRYVPAPEGKMYCFTVPSKFLLFRRNGHVFVSGNTGKTLSCLWAADYLASVGIVRKVLVVAPLSTLDITWGQSIFDSMMHRKYAILHGSREKRLRLLKEDVTFFIVNHEGFAIIKDELPEEIDLVIYDEAARLRNPSTNLFKTFNKFMDSRPLMRLWLLTGTPTPNEPTDAWALCKLIGARVPRYTVFKDMVMKKIAMWKWVARPEAQEIVSNYLQPSILFRRDDCFDLPDMGVETRRCELSVEQKRLYNDLLKKLATDSEGMNITAVNEAAKILKILQVLLGVVYTDGAEQAFVGCESRVNVIKEVIEECDEKVIVFVPFTGALEALEKELGKHFTTAAIYGKVGINARTQIFKDFMDQKHPRVLVADARTMAHGLDLSAATTIIWAGPTNSNETYEQACARILGPKQQHKTTIVHIVATNIEEKIFTRLQHKQSMQGLLLDMIQEKTQEH